MSLSQTVAADQGRVEALGFTAPELVPEGSATLGVSCPKPGWVKQNPEALWQSVADAVTAILGGVDPARIAAAGFYLGTMSRDRQVSSAWVDEPKRRSVPAGWAAATAPACLPAALAAPAR